MKFLVKYWGLQKVVEMHTDGQMDTHVRTFRNDSIGPFDMNQIIYPFAAFVW